MSTWTMRGEAEDLAAEVDSVTDDADDGDVTAAAGASTAGEVDDMG